VSHGIAFAAIPGILYQPNIWVLLRIRRDDLSRIVTGSVIDDDDLRVPPLLGDVGDDLVQSLRNALALVECRYDDAVRKNSTSGVNPNIVRGDRARA
jgi:hypothetical protein